MRKWGKWIICVIFLGCIQWVPLEKLQADSPLDGDKLIVALRPESPTDQDFLTYVGALLEAGYLPRSLVESTFLWAQDKPKHQARYFREGLIRRASDQGISLPTGQPPLEGTVEGQVIYLWRVGLVKIPIPVSYAKVRLAGRHLTTDAQGRFSFQNVPLGVYTVYAEGYAVFAFRQGSIRVRLPTRPPSTDPATVTVYVE